MENKESDSDQLPSRVILTVELDLTLKLYCRLVLHRTGRAQKIFILHWPDNWKNGHMKANKLFSYLKNLRALPVVLQESLCKLRQLTDLKNKNRTFLPLNCDTKTLPDQT